MEYLLGIEDLAAKKVAAKLADGSSLGPDAGVDPTVGAKKKLLVLEPGSDEAKVAMKKIAAKAKDQKMYLGKPLAPGAGPGQGDFQLLVDRLVWERGLSLDQAARIAGRVNQQLNG